MNRLMLISALLAVLNLAACDRPTTVNVPAPAAAPAAVPGPTGPQGATGNQGTKGETGNQGGKGETGKSGSDSVPPATPAPTK
jgi:hypothetical protein